MEQLSNKTLAVFHSYHMSFAAWRDTGILDRELTLYRGLRPYFKKIMFATYASDIAAEQALAGADFAVVSHKNKIALSAADILRVNQMSAMLAAGPIKKTFPEKKLVVRCGFMWSLFQKHRNILKKWFVARIERRAFNLAERIVLTSGADQEYIIKKYDLPKAPIKIIRNVIDTEVFTPSLTSRNLKRICAVGRLEEQKNYDSLIKALAGSDYELHIFGQGTLRSQLEGIAKAVSAHVIFRGVVPNVELASELAHCGAFVLASRYEGNPKALLEAMSAGLPVVASNIANHRDIITSGQNGLLCESDPGSLRGAIDKVMQNNELAATLGKSARQWILEHCSLSTILKQEIELYESLYA